MSTEATYLDTILADKRAELEAGRPDNLSMQRIEAELAHAPPPRDFWQALSEGPKPRVIAEFKRRSPREGPLCEDAEPRVFGQAYQAAGAAAISVLTDRHFGGSFEDLRAVRSAVSVPVLCKDFILSRNQLVQARREGADAALLIVAALEPPHLRDLYNFARDIGLRVLMEAHDERELERALATGAKIIGMNARNLNTFAVDLDNVIRHRLDVPSSFVYVGESGIGSRRDVERLRAAGVDAILVGSVLMKADDPRAKLAELMAV